MNPVFSSCKSIILEARLQHLYLSIKFSETYATDLDNYKILVENVKDYAIFILDINGHITSWNKGAEKIKGYKEQEVIGRHSSIFYTKEDIEKKIPEKNLQTAKKLGQFEDGGLAGPHKMVLCSGPV